MAARTAPSSSGASEPAGGWLQARASPRRRRWLLAGGALQALLGTVMLASPAPAAHLSGALCALAAIVLACSALRQRAAARRLPVSLGWPAPGRWLPDAIVAEYCGPRRIVLRGAHGRIVVWRDAIDPAAFRRLAVAARWRGGAAMQ